MGKKSKRQNRVKRDSAATTNSAAPAATLSEAQKVAIRRMCDDLDYWPTPEELGLVAPTPSEANAVEAYMEQYHHESHRNRLRFEGDFGVADRIAMQKVRQCDPQFFHALLTRSNIPKKAMVRLGFPMNMTRGQAMNYSVQVAEEVQHELEVKLLASHQNKDHGPNDAETKSRNIKPDPQFLESKVIGLQPSFSVSKSGAQSQAQTPSQDNSRGVPRSPVQPGNAASAAEETAPTEPAKQVANIMLCRAPANVAAPSKESSSVVQTEQQESGLRARAETKEAIDVDGDSMISPATLIAADSYFKQYRKNQVALDMAAAATTGDGVDISNEQESQEYLWFYGDYGPDDLWLMLQVKQRCPEQFHSLLTREFPNTPSVPLHIMMPDDFPSQYCGDYVVSLANRMQFDRAVRFSFFGNDGAADLSLMHRFKDCYPGHFEVLVNEADAVPTLEKIEVTFFDCFEGDPTTYLRELAARVKNNDTHSDCHDEHESMSQTTPLLSALGPQLRKESDSVASCAGTCTSDTINLCKICSKPPKRMTTLWCGHTFCRDCILTHAKKESQYCPECGFDLCLDIYFPFSVPPRGFKDKDVCFWCRKEGPKKSMLVCEVCYGLGEVTTYCSPECQRAAWVVHKKTAHAFWETKAEREG